MCPLNTFNTHFLRRQERPKYGQFGATGTWLGAIYLNRHKGLDNLWLADIRDVPNFANRMNYQGFRDGERAW